MTLSVSRLYSINDGMINECEAVGGTGRGNQSIGRKLASVPLCPPQIPYDLNWDRTQVPMVRRR
jgi:hypothetical protein